MAQAQQTYKRSFSGSVGAGMKSLFGSQGRRFYTLVHKVSSKYHKAGESQQIIIDEITIGRAPDCQVRFDESFTTVSRHHAAIVKDGDNWKLVQLSKTNSTYLNGRKVQNEWYLQNGDEIQLSTNGPKLGFIVPEGEKGSVKSLGLSARLSLFRQQALRPYKTGITVICCVLAALIIGGGYVIYDQKTKINDLSYTIIEDQEQVAGLLEDLQKSNQQITDLTTSQNELKKLAEQADKRAREAEKRFKELEERGLGGASSVNMTKYHPYVFLIKLYKVTVDGNLFMQAGKSGWIACGTGFLLNDGRFVTARHVVQGHREMNLNEAMESSVAAKFVLCNILENLGHDVKFYFRAVSTTMSFEFTSADFTLDDSTDQCLTLEKNLKIATGDVLPAGTVFREGGYYFDNTDWAYIPTTEKTGLKFDTQKSNHLEQGTPLYLLGYPQGRGEGNPILSEGKCSQNNLDTDGTIMVSNIDSEPGNSGGPVFIMQDGEATVIGIVFGTSYKKGRIMPIGALR